MEQGATSRYSSHSGRRGAAPVRGCFAPAELFKLPKLGFVFSNRILQFFHSFDIDAFEDDVAFSEGASCGAHQINSKRRNQ